MNHVQDGTRSPNLGLEALRPLSFILKLFRLASPSHSDTGGSMYPPSTSTLRAVEVRDEPSCARF